MKKESVKPIQTVEIICEVLEESLSKWLKLHSGITSVILNVQDLLNYR